MEDELLTVEEVARSLKVTRKAVYDLMRAKRLPYVQIGVTRGRRIRKSALEAFLKGANRGVETEGKSDYTSEGKRNPRLAATLTP
jgi:excisionase family DNA binding protein